MRYVTYLEEPTLESYRLDHSPRDGLGSVLICWWADVTGAAGDRYNVMRAIELPEKHLSLNFGAYRGTGRLDEAGPLAFSFREHPAVEPYWVEQAADATVYAGQSFRLALGVSDYAWSDARGPRRDHRAATGAGVHVLGARAGGVRASGSLAQPFREGDRCDRR